MCCVLSHFSHVQPFVTSWTVARQAPLSMGILQARILEWVSMPSSRGSSQLRDQTWVSRIMGGFFTIWATKEDGHFYGAIWNHTYIMPMGRLTALKSISILLEISDKQRHHKLAICYRLTERAKLFILQILFSDWSIVKVKALSQIKYFLCTKHKSTIKSRR